MTLNLTNKTNCSLYNIPVGHHLNLHRLHTSNSTLIVKSYNILGAISWGISEISKNLAKLSIFIITLVMNLYPKESWKSFLQECFVPGCIREMMKMWKVNAIYPSHNGKYGHLFTKKLWINLFQYHSNYLKCLLNLLATCNK